MLHIYSLLNKKGSAILEYGLVATLLCSVALPSIAKVGGISDFFGTRNLLEEPNEKELLYDSIKNQKGLGSLAVHPHEHLTIPKDAQKKFTFYVIQSDKSHTTIVFMQNKNGEWVRENAIKHPSV